MCCTGAITVHAATQIIISWVPMAIIAETVQRRAARLKAKSMAAQNSLKRKPLRYWLDQRLVSHIDCWPTPSRYHGPRFSIWFKVEAGHTCRQKQKGREAPLVLSRLMLFSCYGKRTFPLIFPLPPLPFPGPVEPPPPPPPGAVPTSGCGYV
jgi:hypothetical protein